MAANKCIIPGCFSTNAKRTKPSARTSIFTIKEFERNPKYKELNERLLQCVKEYAGLTPDVLSKLHRGRVGICRLHFKPGDILDFAKGTYEYYILNI